MSGGARGYELPVTVSVGGRELPIRTDFRAVLDVLASAQDPELDDRARAAVMLRIMFPDWRDIEPQLIGEALAAACDFIDCGHAERFASRIARTPQIVDWSADAGLIAAAVNGVAHTEVRALPYLHWWTFLSYFLEIGDCLYSTVLSIRYKRARGRKLDPSEREFYRENRALIDMKRPQAAAATSADAESGSVRFAAAASSPSAISGEEAAILKWL